MITKSKEQYRRSWIGKLVGMCPVKFGKIDRVSMGKRKKKDRILIRIWKLTRILIIISLLAYTRILMEMGMAMGMGM